MVLSIVQVMLVNLFFMVHPFFISMTEVNYNAPAKTVEVSVRIFADDFEKALVKSCNCKVDLTLPAIKAATDKMVSEYISKHLALDVDGKPVVLQYEGYQMEEGSLWSYFEVKNVASVKKIDINNNLLYEYNTSQINMVHVKANGKEQTNKLEYPDRVLSWGF
ncbi:MAG: hypothetical protein LH478_10640 [Chitinophagaceae bacterium]|nr:hypothetical protein [Chitinophagaceae bacterium]